MPIPSLFDRIPEVFRDRFDPNRPWDLLGGPLDDILAALPSSRLDSALPPECHLAGDRIVIEAGVAVAPGATLHGPLFVAAGAEIRPGAFVRGGCWIGPGCVVGANTEIKHSILWPGAKAPHLNYVGDSILGRGVNLGAGTILSNFRHDGREIRIPAGDQRLATGRRKLGAVLGDRVSTGCNCVLHPGVVVGANSQLYPGVQLRSGIVPGQAIVKLRQQLDIVSANTTGA